jgi:hypothetical protein
MEPTYNSTSHQGKAAILKDFVIEEFKRLGGRVAVRV